MMDGKKTNYDLLIKCKQQMRRNEAMLCWQHVDFFSVKVK